MDNKNNSGSRLNHQFLMLLTQMRNTINQNYSFMSCLTSMSTCCVAIFRSLAFCSCMYHDKLPSPRAKNQTKCTALLINHRMANSDFHKYNCEAWYLFFFRRSLDSLCEKQENARTALLRKIPPLQPVHQGVALVPSTPINHIVLFFCRIQVVLENRKSSRGGGGVYLCSNVCTYVVM